jgi:hypothetical protein
LVCALQVQQVDREACVEAQAGAWHWRTPFLCRTPQVPTHPFTHPATHSHCSTGLLQAASINLLETGAETELEQQLQTVKWDLCFSPARFASWERLAAGYHEAADGLLVGGPYPLNTGCPVGWKARPVLCGPPPTTLGCTLGLPPLCCKSATWRARLSVPTSTACLHCLRCLAAACAEPGQPGDEPPGVQLQPGPAGQVWNCASGSCSGLTLPADVAAADMKTTTVAVVCRWMPQQLLLCHLLCR